VISILLLLAAPTTHAQEMLVSLSVEGPEHTTELAMSTEHVPIGEGIIPPFSVDLDQDTRVRFQPSVIEMSNGSSGPEWTVSAQIDVFSITPSGRDGRLLDTMTLDPATFTAGNTQVLGVHREGFDLKAAFMMSETHVPDVFALAMPRTRRQHGDELDAREDQIRRREREARIRRRELDVIEEEHQLDERTQGLDQQ